MILHQLASRWSLAERNRNKRRAYLQNEAHHVVSADGTKAWNRITSRASPKENPLLSRLIFPGQEVRRRWWNRAEGAREGARAAMDARLSKKRILSASVAGGSSPKSAHHSFSPAFIRRSGLSLTQIPARANGAILMQAWRSRQ